MRNESIETFLREGGCGERFRNIWVRLSEKDESEEDEESEEKGKADFMPSPKEYRFRETKKISINPPSKILHLSNIAKEIYTEAQIKNLFSGNALKVKWALLLRRLLNLPNEEKCMALAEINTLENSLMIISTLHNNLFFGR